MTAIPRRYTTDAKNQKQVVIVDIETFNRRESIIEDHDPGIFMEEAEDDEILSVREAKKHDKSPKKGLRMPACLYGNISFKDPAAGPDATGPGSSRSMLIKSQNPILVFTNLTFSRCAGRRIRTGSGPGVNGLVVGSRKDNIIIFCWSKIREEICRDFSLSAITAAP